eukprot:GFUD01019259.1.p1 GENE.GFUD01019259.1~~GFUD01019259.1.p1  ORF type:complete len:168 (-),score=57.61 GFUD01019259.1:21-524(-)
MGKDKQTKNVPVVTMDSRGDHDKENRSPMKMKDAKASSSLADVVSNDEAVTKVGRKTPGRVTPLTIPSYTLSPKGEEFQLPPHISTLSVDTNLTTSLFSSLSITPPFSPHFPPPSERPQYPQPPSGAKAVVEQPGYISLRRLHYSGLAVFFTVGNAGHSTLMRRGGV